MFLPGNVKLKSGIIETPAHASSSGVPKIRKILKSSSICESPSKEKKEDECTSFINDRDITYQEIKVA